MRPQKKLTELKWKRTSPHPVHLIRPPQAKVKYSLAVHTTDVKGADFQGAAYVTLSGWWGTSKEVRNQALSLP